MSGRLSHPIVHDGSLRRPPASFSFRIAPDPLPWEPAHGWALRAARMNGHPSLSHLAFQIGMSGLGSPSAWLELARRSDVRGIDQLAANTPVPSDDGYLVRAERFASRRLAFEHRRFCPGCLRESAHHRFFWDFTFFNTCPFHDCPIRGGRRDIDLAVDWRGTDLRLSRDGRLLQVEAKTVEVMPRTMETYVLGRLGVAAPSPSPILDPFPLEDILSAVRPLGILLTLPEERLTEKRDKSWVLHAQHQEAGFEALAGNLHHLDDRLSAVAERSLRSINEREEVFRRKLFGHLPRPVGGLWSVVDDAIQRITRQTAAARRGDSGIPSGKLRYSLVEFAGEVGIHYQVLSRFIDLIGLVPERRTIRGIVQYLRSDVDAVTEMIDTSMRAGEVTALLGINGRRIQDLVGFGLIRMVPGGGRRPQGKWYMRSDVEALAALVDALPEPSVATVTFDALAKNMNIRFSELVRRVVSREVVPVGQAGTGMGFRRLRFDLSSMSHPAARGLSAVSAAAVLGLTQKTVKWLVAEGHLESVNGDMRRYGIVKSSVDRLLVEYEPTDTYAPKLGCSPRIAAYRLAEMGVRVIKRGPSDAGSGMASGRGLAHRDDLARVFPRDLETVAVCSELVDGWERLRAAALTSEGCWVLPAILSAAEMRLFMSSMKLAVTLRFGRAATLTADCSPSSAVRRSRILDAARPFLADRLPLFQEVGPGGWLLVSEIKLGTGATTVTEAHATWLRDALSSLGRMFASRDAV